MAKKKELVRNQEQFLVRLPQGMRERIKAKADRAEMSMNEAIVWCLEKHFPEPKTLEAKVGELAQMVAALKQGSDIEGQIDQLVDQIDTTLREIADGRIPASEGFRRKVTETVEGWDYDAIEIENDDPFDDNNYPDEIGGIPYSEVDWNAPINLEDPLALTRKKKKDE